MKAVVLLFEVSLALKVAEYRFGLNFGETIYDYSEKGKLGTNLKFKTTDRGVYLDGSLNSITMKNPSVPSTSSIIFWILPKSQSGAIVCYGNENESLIQLRSDSSELRLDWVSKTNSGVKSAGSNSFIVGTWKLVLRTRKATNCNIFGSCSILQYNIKVSSYTATGDLPNSSLTSTFFFQIGARGSYQSIQGFLWYFLMTDTIESYASYLTTSNPESCILNSCLSCSEKIIDPKYGNICLSTSLSDTKNKENSDCPANIGCSLAYSYSCTCSTKSCEYDQNTNKYFCKDSVGVSTPQANPTCLLPYVARSNSCCLDVCSDCTTPKACTSCIDPNAEVVTDNCQCKAGFFGSPSTSATSSCFKCGLGCSNCLSSTSCQACYDTNAQVSEGGCICKDGFAGTPASSNGAQGCIIPCVPGCGTCSGSICLSCADTNSQVDGNNQCVCKTGYQGTPSSNSIISGCSYLCSPLCSSCDASSTCLTCFDINSITSGSTCVCKSGFLGTPSSNSLSSGCLSLCTSSCKDCSNTGCKSCIDPLATLNNIGECICSPNTIGLPSSDPQNISGCQSCPTTRFQISNTCGDCKDENAALDTNSECFCKIGFLGLPSTDSTIPGCIPSCTNACSNCLNSLCTICKDINAEVLNHLCVCKAGFTGSPSEDITTSGCQKTCPPECICSGSTCESCLDSFAEVAENQCQCKAGYQGSPSTSSGSPGCYSQCLDDCDLCEASRCLKCKDNNALPENGICQCKDGFFGSPFNGVDEDVCQACGPGCKTCPSLLQCQGCFDSSAFLDGGRCYCLQFMYLGFDNFCNSCSMACTNCSDFIGCQDCLLANSQPFNGTCVCNNGTFAVGEISENNPCQPCNSDCKTCETEDLCLTCLSVNAKPSTIEGCDCNEGFWKFYSGELEDYCKPCKTRCKSCENGSSCTECKGNSTLLINGQCLCDQGFYFPESESVDCIPCRTGNNGKCNFTCEYRQVFRIGDCFDCPKNCEACDQTLNCTECLNKDLPVNGECKCPKGMKWIDEECKPKTFEMKYKISRSNEIYLSFQEAPEIELIADMILLNSSKKTLDFSLKKLTKISYKITLDDNIQSKSRLEFTLIILYNPLYSVNSAELKKYIYSSELNQQNSSSVNKELSTACQLAAGAVLATSLVSNPTTSWIALNTIQLITYLPLASIDFSEEMLDFLQAIGSYNTMPELIGSYISTTSSKKPGKRYNRVGIETSVFWVNFGKCTILLMIYLAFIPVMLLGLLFRATRSRSLKILQNYWLSVFLRFFIQTYLDICLLSLIQITHVRITQTVTEDSGYFSLGSACLLIVFSALAPIVSYFVVVSIDPQDPSYSRKYGSLFEEFKHNGKKITKMFYVGFFIRRFEYAFSQVLLFHYPICQMALNISFSFVQFAFLAYFRPFKDIFALVSEFLGEICVLITFVSSFVLILVDDREIVYYFEKTVQWTVISGIGIQVCICFGAAIRTAKEFYETCKKRNQRVVFFSRDFTSNKQIDSKGIENMNLHSTRIKT